MLLTLFRPLRAALFVSIALVALIAAGCGGGGEEDAKSTIDKAFKKPIKSARVSLNAEAQVSGSPQFNQPVKFTLTGPYKSNGDKKVPSFDWDMSLAGGGQSIQAGLASTGDNAFVEFQGSAYEVGAQEIAKTNQQLAQNTSQPGQRTLKDFGIDPKNWVTKAEEKGEQKVGGVETTHVSAGLNMRRMFTDLNKTIDKAGNTVGRTPPQKITDQQITQIEQVVKKPRFDIYVGKDDDVLRRIAIALNFDVPQTQQQQTGGATGGKFTFSLEFADVGKPQTVTAPPNPKPLSELQKAAGSLGALGAGGAGGGGGTPGAMPTP